MLLTRFPLPLKRPSVRPAVPPQMATAPPTQRRVSNRGLVARAACSRAFSPSLCVWSHPSSTARSSYSWGRQHRQYSSTDLGSPSQAHLAHLPGALPRARGSTGGSGARPPQEQQAPRAPGPCALSRHTCSELTTISRPSPVAWASEAATRDAMQVPGSVIMGVPAHRTSHPAWMVMARQLPSAPWSP